MIGKTFELLKKATWFLNSGVTPDGASEEKKQQLADVNHLESKKFAMTMVALSIIAIMYFSSVTFLFLFKTDAQVTALVSMYKDMIVAVASIAGTLVGIQGLVDWKHNDSTSTEIKSESIKQEVLQVLTHNTKEEDYDISEVHV